MQQAVQDSDRCYSVDMLASNGKGNGSRNWSDKEVQSVILFSWVKHVSPIKIHCQLAEAYDGVIMRVKQIRK
jgi:hypothetical protein